MIITRSYFNKNIRLANITGVSPDEASANGLLLDEFIKKYERVILIRCFGYPLYKEFSEQFDVNETTGLWTLKDDADDKWNALLNGKEYTLNGKLTKWNGIIYNDKFIEDAEPNTSFIANYVYCMFLENEEFSHSGVGFQREKSKNAMIMDAKSKIAKAYNEMVDCINEMYTFIREHSEDYENFNPEEFCYTNRYGL